VATSVNNLEGFYANQGEYRKAEPFYERALAIREKALGSEHPDVATSLYNLALLSKDANRLSETEPLMRRSAAILLKFSQLTGRLHWRLRTVFLNYYSLMRDLSLSPEEIFKRIAELSQEAGLDSESYSELVKRILDEE